MVCVLFFGTGCVSLGSYLVSSSSWLDGCLSSRPALNHDWQSVVKVTSKTQGEPGSGRFSTSKWPNPTPETFGNAEVLLGKYVDDGYSMNSLGGPFFWKGWRLKTKDLGWSGLKTWVDESLNKHSRLWHIRFPVGIPLRPNWHQVKAVRFCLAPPLSYMMAINLSYVIQ